MVVSILSPASLARMRMRMRMRMEAVVLRLLGDTRTTIIVSMISLLGFTAVEIAVYGLV